MNSLVLCSNTSTRNKPQLLRYSTLLFLLLASGLSFAQQNGSIHGTVTTSDGKPAEHVNVALQGTTQGAAVKHTGNYKINAVKPGQYTIVASFVGVTPQTKDIEVKAGEELTVDFVISADSKQLAEVVIQSHKTNKFAVLKSPDVAKMPLNDLENSQAYTTVTASLMNEQGVYNMDGAIKNVPGAYQLWAATDRSGFGNGSSFVLRGFQINISLRNGMPSNISTTVDDANIESIEVLKGPSATLYGSAVTSYGGVINRVTKKPYDHFGGEVTYDGGSFGFNRLTADINTPIDSAKKTLFRLNTSLNTQRSWQDAGFHNSIFVAPSLSYKANDRLSFLFDAEIYKSSGTTPQIFFFSTTADQIGVHSADKLNLDYNRSYISNDLVLNSTNLNFSGQMNYKISDNWSSQTNISVANTSSYGPMPYFYLMPGNNTLARMVWTIDGYDNTFDIQQNFTGNFNFGSVKNRFLAGIDYYNYNANVRYHEFTGTAGGMTEGDLFDVINSTGNIPNYLNFNKAKVDSAYANSPAYPYEYIISQRNYIASAYVSDVINITDQLIVNAALRVDHFQDGGAYSLISGTTSGAYKQVAFSPKFGLIYQVVKDKLSLFGNYQNGFQNVNGVDSLGHSFKPEQANQLEGGVKMNLFNGKLSGTLSYYDIKVKNVIRQSSDFRYSIQDGTQFSKGFEAELIANPFDGFNISAGYAHNDSKLTTDSQNSDIPDSGPRDMANAWLSYRFLKGDVKGLGFGFGGNYAGRAEVQQDFYIPSYTVFNSTVFYDAGKFRVGVNVNNLTNKRYWIGWYTVNPQQPRTINGSIAFRF